MVRYRRFTRWPGRVDRSHPARTLAGDRPTFVPACLFVVGRENARLPPQLVELGLQPADLRGERADGAKHLFLVLERGIA